MAGIQTNRTATGILLPAEVSSQIWQDAQAASVVMQHAGRIDLPGEGIAVPMITGDPVASWVGETDEIAVGDSSFSNRTIQAQKVGIIELFSNEFKRDLPALYAALAERLPKTIGTAFDEKVFHGAGSSTFDTLNDAQFLTLDGTDTYGDMVAIDSAIYEANGVTDAWIVAPKARRVLIGAKDADGNPLLLSSLVDGRNVPQILGADVSYSKAVYHADAAGDQGEILGLAGQWAGNAFYGNVSGIEVSISTDATINKGGTQVNLFQRDMFALKVTAWLGFAVRDKAKFVRVGSGVNAIA
jgi:HK97 family phage major capsid protein